MTIVHLTRHLIPYWPDAADSRAAAELPLAQQGRERNVRVIAQAPVHERDSFTSSLPFAARLTPLDVTGAQGQAVKVDLLEGGLEGGGIPLQLLVLPADAADAQIFGAAATELMASWPDPPKVVHLHGDTGVDVDALRGRLDGVAVVQSVYEVRTDDAAQVAGVTDADVVVETTAGLLTGSEAEGGRAKVVAPGIDLQRWNPAADSALAAGFGPDDWSGKAACRSALQTETGLAPRDDVPLVAVWSRPGDGSGLGLMAEQLDELLGMDLQLLVVRPTCWADAEEGLAPFAQDRVHVMPDEDPATLRRLLAGCDGVILPDASALLGRRARIAMRYGLVPVARRVQCQRELLVEFDQASGTGGAFLFDDPVEKELPRAVLRLRKTFGDREVFDGMRAANAQVDLDWARPLSQLDEIYKKALTT